MRLHFLNCLIIVMIATQTLGEILQKRSINEPNFPESVDAFFDNGSEEDLEDNFNNLRYLPLLEKPFLDKRSTESNSMTFLRRSRIHEKHKKRNQRHLVNYLRELDQLMSLKRLKHKIRRKKGCVPLPPADECASDEPYTEKHRRIHLKGLPNDAPLLALNRQITVNCQLTTTTKATPPFSKPTTTSTRLWSRTSGTTPKPCPTQRTTTTTEYSTKFRTVHSTACTTNTKFKFVTKLETTSSRTQTNVIWPESLDNTLLVFRRQIRALEEQKAALKRKFRRRALFMENKHNGNLIIDNIELENKSRELKKEMDDISRFQSELELKRTQGKNRLNNLETRKNKLRYGGTPSTRRSTHFHFEQFEPFSPKPSTGQLFNFQTARNKQFETSSEGHRIEKPTERSGLFYIPNYQQHFETSSYQQTVKNPHQPVYEDGDFSSQEVAPTDLVDSNIFQALHNLEQRLKNEKSTTPNSFFNSKHRGKRKASYPDLPIHHFAVTPINLNSKYKTGFSRKSPFKKKFHVRSMFRKKKTPRTVVPRKKKTYEKSIEEEPCDVTDQNLSINKQLSQEFSNRAVMGEENAGITGEFPTEATSEVNNESITQYHSPIYVNLPTNPPNDSTDDGSIENYYLQQLYPTTKEAHTRAATEEVHFEPDTTENFATLNKYFENAAKFKPWSKKRLEGSKKQITIRTKYETEESEHKTTEDVGKFLDEIKEKLHEYYNHHYVTTTQETKENALETEEHKTIDNIDDLKPEELIQYEAKKRLEEHSADQIQTPVLITEESLNEINEDHEFEIQQPEYDQSKKIAIRAKDNNDETEDNDDDQEEESSEEKSNEKNEDHNFKVPLSEYDQSKASQDEEQTENVPERQMEEETETEADDEEENTTEDPKNPVTIPYHIDPETELRQQMFENPKRETESKEENETESEEENETEADEEQDQKKNKNTAIQAHQEPKVLKQYQYSEEDDEGTDWKIKEIEHELSAYQKYHDDHEPATDETENEAIWEKKGHGKPEWMIKEHGENEHKTQKPQHTTEWVITERGKNVHKTEKTQHEPEEHTEIHTDETKTEIHEHEVEEHTELKTTTEHETEEYTENKVKESEHEKNDMDHPQSEYDDAEKEPTVPEYPAQVIETPVHIEHETEEQVDNETTEYVTEEDENETEKHVEHVEHKTEEHTKNKVEAPKHEELTTRTEETEHAEHKAEHNEKGTEVHAEHETGGHTEKETEEHAEHETGGYTEKEIEEYTENKVKAPKHEDHSSKTEETKEHVVHETEEHVEHETEEVNKEIVTKEHENEATTEEAKLLLEEIKHKILEHGTTEDPHEVLEQIKEKLDVYNRNHLTTTEEVEHAEISEETKEHTEEHKLKTEKYTKKYEHETEEHTKEIVTKPQIEEEEAKERTEEHMLKTEEHTKKHEHEIEVHTKENEAEPQTEEEETKEHIEEHKLKSEEHTKKHEHEIEEHTKEIVTKPQIEEEETQDHMDEHKPKTEEHTKKHEHETEEYTKPQIEEEEIKEHTEDHRLKTEKNTEKHEHETEKYTKEIEIKPHTEEEIQEHTKVIETETQHEEETEEPSKENKAEPQTEKEEIEKHTKENKTESQAEDEDEEEEEEDEEKETEEQTKENKTESQAEDEDDEEETEEHTKENKTVQQIIELPPEEEIVNHSTDKQGTVEHTELEKHPKENETEENIELKTEEHTEHTTEGYLHKTNEHTTEIHEHVPEEETQEIHLKTEEATHETKEATHETKEATHETKEATHETEEATHETEEKAQETEELSTEIKQETQQTTEEADLVLKHIAEELAKYENNVEHKNNTEEVSDKTINQEVPLKSDKNKEETTTEETTSVKTSEDAEQAVIEALHKFEEYEEHHLTTTQYKNKYNTEEYLHEFQTTEDEGQSVKEAMHEFEEFEQHRLRTTQHDNDKIELKDITKPEYRTEEHLHELQTTEDAEALIDEIMKFDANKTRGTEKYNNKITEHHLTTIKQESGEAHVTEEEKAEETVEATNETEEKSEETGEATPETEEKTEEAVETTPETEEKEEEAEEATPETEEKAEETEEATPETEEATNEADEEAIHETEEKAEKTEEVTTEIKQEADIMLKHIVQELAEYENLIHHKNKTQKVSGETVSPESNKNLKETTEETASTETTKEAAAVETTEETAPVESTSEKTASVEPTSEETASVEPTSEETASVEPISEETASIEPTSEETASVELTSEETASAEPTSEKTASVEPTTEKTASVEPTTEKIISVEPTTEKIVSVEPTTEKIVSLEPTTEKTDSVEATSGKTASVETTSGKTFEETAPVEPTSEETNEGTSVEPKSAETIAELTTSTDHKTASTAEEQTTVSSTTEKEITSESYQITTDETTSESHQITEEATTSESHQITEDTTSESHQITTEVSNISVASEDSEDLYSELSMTNKAIHLSNNCELSDYEANDHCICSVKHVLKDLADDIKEINSTKKYEYICSNFIRIDPGIIISNKSESKILRKRKTGEFTETYVWKREARVGRDINNLLQQDLVIPFNGTVNYVNVGSKVVIPCSNDPEDANDNNMKYIWTIKNGSPETTGDRINNGSSLIIPSASPQDSDNYTCTLEDRSSHDRTVHVHQLSVVSLPGFNLVVTVHLNVSSTCEPGDMEVLNLYYPVAIKDLLCSGATEKVCSIAVEKPQCIRLGSDDIISLHATLSTESLSNMLPRLNTDTCNLPCQSRIYSIIATILLKNLASVTNLPVFFRLSYRKAELTPVQYQKGDKKNMVSNSIMTICPPGFGIYENPKLCQACEAYTFNPGNEMKCAPCPRGSYQPAVGSRMCLPCNSPLDDSSCFLPGAIAKISRKFYIIPIVSMVAVLLFICTCICIQRKSIKRRKLKDKNKIDIAIQKNLSIQSMKKSDKSIKKSESNREAKLKIKSKSKTRPRQNASNSEIEIVVSNPYPSKSKKAPDPPPIDF